MKVREFGSENKDTIILLHGGGLSWWNYIKAAALLKDRFRVIIPILDGHDESDQEFTTIEDNANRIIDFIDEKCGGKVKLIGGLSLGAQVLLEILSKEKDICDFAVIESALAVPISFAGKMIDPCLNLFYNLIQKKWFSKLQFKFLKIDEEYFANYALSTKVISKNSYSKILKESLSFTPNLKLSECKAKAFLFVGSEENSLVKKSAEKLQSILSESKLFVVKGFSHGSLSLNNAALYSNVITEIVEKGSD